MSADYQKDGSIAVITLNNPPVNGLGLATRRAVVEGVNRANHSLVMANYISRANAAVMDLRQLLSWWQTACRRWPFIVTPCLF